MDGPNCLSNPILLSARASLKSNGISFSFPEKQLHAMLTAIEGRSSRIKNFGFITNPSAECLNVDGIQVTKNIRVREEMIYAMVEEPNDKEETVFPLPKCPIWVKDV